MQQLRDCGAQSNWCLQELAFIPMPVLAKLPEPASNMGGRTALMQVDSSSSLRVITRRPGLPSQPAGCDSNVCDMARCDSCKKLFGSPGLSVTHICLIFAPAFCDHAHFVSLFCLLPL